MAGDEALSEPLGGHRMRGAELLRLVQRVIGRLMTAVERVRVDTEGDFTDILDRLDAIDVEQLDATHTFTLSQVYEDLLLKMGEKNSDGGQFFTPREVVRAVVATLNPTFGETVYDPCCGTGGFLAQSFEWMKARMGDEALSTIPFKVTAQQP